MCCGLLLLRLSSLAMRPLFYERLGSSFHITTFLFHAAPSAMCNVYSRLHCECETVFHIQIVIMAYDCPKQNRRCLLRLQLLQSSHHLDIDESSAPDSNPSWLDSCHRKLLWWAAHCLSITIAAHLDIYKVNRLALRHLVLLFAYDGKGEP
jgi:hypothetical protein